LFLAHLSHQSSVMPRTQVKDDGEVTVTVRMSEQTNTLVKEEDA
jgi:hypothetical protein